jgi:hypothetical protein
VNAVFARLGRGARRIGGGIRRVVKLIGPAPLAVLLVALAAAVVGLVLARGGSEPPGGASLPSLRVGVSDGDSIPAYLTAQQAELAQLTGRAPDTPVYALVSFARYLTPDEVAAVLPPELTLIAGYGRVPLPEQQTELVRLPATHLPADLITAMRAVADRKTREAADAQARSPRVAELVKSEADAYQAVCGCVYAFVVRGAPTALTALSRADAVRVVDAAPELADPAFGVFVAVLPEQTDVVKPLPDPAGAAADQASPAG